jgi:hypothetical protein
MKQSPLLKSHFLTATIAWFVGITLLMSVPSAWADLGNDIEKPKPTFTTDNNKMTAKLIPRGKSTSVLIDFKINGGKLTDVKGVDFEAHESPEVDIKNFKSALFEIQVSDLPVGGESKISLISDFFTSSTAFYIHNPQKKAWLIPPTPLPVENISLPNLVQELVITVKDGGEFDGDGATNGQITLLGGPRDSFWGYALGTLFIRFFGIFIVLGVLQIGMLISGQFFKRMETVPESAPKSKPSALKASIQEADKTERVVPPETVAAIAVALSLDPVGSRIQQAVSPEIAAAITVALSLEVGSDVCKPDGQTFSSDPTCSWTQQGRNQSMQDRCSQLKR